MPCTHDLTLKNLDETLGLGRTIARHLRAGDVIALSGDLGVGKTTLARGIISPILEESGLDAEEIPSPTFTLVQPYPWPHKNDPEREIWHIDLWRLDDPNEAAELGFDEATSRHAIIIEWPEKLAQLRDHFLGPQTFNITLTTIDENARKISLSPSSPPHWEDFLKAIG